MPSMDRVGFTDVSNTLQSVSNTLAAVSNTLHPVLYTRVAPGVPWRVAYACGTCPFRGVGGPGTPISGEVSNLNESGLVNRFLVLIEFSWSLLKRHRLAINE